MVVPLPVLELLFGCGVGGTAEFVAVAGAVFAVLLTGTDAGAWSLAAGPAVELAGWPLSLLPGRTSGPLSPQPAAVSIAAAMTATAAERRR